MWHFIKFIIDLQCTKNHINRNFQMFPHQRHFRAFSCIPKNSRFQNRWKWKTTSDLLWFHFYSESNHEIPSTRKQLNKYKYISYLYRATWKHIETDQSENNCCLSVSKCLSTRQCWAWICPLGVASSRKVCEWVECLLHGGGRYASLFLAPARNVISTLSLSERGPIAVQQRLSDSNQSERTTPDCQQTYIRVAAKPSSVINGIYTNIENLVNHYWTSRWTVKKRKFETLKPISNSIQSPTKNLVNYSIKLFLIG